MLSTAALNISAKSEGLTAAVESMARPTDIDFVTGNSRGASTAAK
jgi:hypothetical protein